MTQGEFLQGLFDLGMNKEQRRSIAREVDGQMLRNISYDMI